MAIIEDILRATSGDLLFESARQEMENDMMLAPDDDDQRPYFKVLKLLDSMLDK